MKVLFAPDTSDHPNWGCRFMGEWYGRRLRALEGAELRRIGSRWFFQDDPKCPAPVTWNDLLAIEQAVRRGQVLTDVRGLISRCDLLFMNAENFIRPGVLKGRRALMLAYIAKMVFGKPVIVTNISLDLSEPALAELAAHVFPVLDVVQIRDDVSAAEYAALVPTGCYGRNVDVGWTAEPANLSAWTSLALRDSHFSAWPDRSDGFDATRPYITVCASSAYAAPAATDPTESLLTLCEKLNREIAPVVLVAPCEVDAMIMRKVQARTGFPLLGLNLPVHQGIDVLGSARVHVGGRWHPGMFAACGGTPLVAIAANTHKMATLMAGLDPEAPVFDALNIGAQVDAIVEQAGQQIDGGELLRSRVLSHAAAMREQVDQELSLVSRLAAPHGVSGH